MTRMRRFQYSWRAIAFALLSTVCIVVPAVYVLRAAKPPVDDQPREPLVHAASNASVAAAPSMKAPPIEAAPAHEAPPTKRPAAPPSAPRAVELATPATSIPAPRHVLFRYAGLGELHGRLVSSALDAKDLAPTSLRCERVHIAAGQGVCLEAKRKVFTTYSAALFDATFEVRHRLPLTGTPSRVRVSPDGRYAAVTVFEGGHSYAAAFSTRTSIIDLGTGEFAVPTLEAFTVLRDGVAVHAPDFNFWGVTFARDGDRFYATLATGGQPHLVEGSVAARTVRIIRPQVECPALSPDNRRIAFKKRTGGMLTPVTWRLTVLDLDTGEERALAETRSVDDQADWLDDANVIYAVPEADSGTVGMNTYAVPADGSGTPRLLVQHAYSLVPISR